MFTPYEYTWTTSGKGLAQIGAFIATFLGVCYTVKLTYPDRIAVPREYENGLARELGGAGAVRVGRRLAAGVAWIFSDAHERTLTIPQARSPEDADAELAELDA